MAGVCSLPPGGITFSIVPGENSGAWALLLSHYRDVERIRGLRSGVRRYITGLTFLHHSLRVDPQLDDLGGYAAERLSDSLQQGRKVNTPQGWLNRTARHEGINLTRFLEQQLETSPVAPEYLFRHPEADHIVNDRHHRREELIAEVCRFCMLAVPSMPPKFGEVFEVHLSRTSAGLEHSPEEIANTLGISTNRARSYLSRAFKRLRELIDQGRISPPTYLLEMWNLRDPFFPEDGIPFLPPEEGEWI